MCQRRQPQCVSVICVDRVEHLAELVVNRRQAALGRPGCETVADAGGIQRELQGGLVREEDHLAVVGSVVTVVFDDGFDLREGPLRALLQLAFGQHQVGVVGGAPGGEHVVLVVRLLLEVVHFDLDVVERITQFQNVVVQSKKLETRNFWPRNWGISKLFPRSGRVD